MILVNGELLEGAPPGAWSTHGATVFTTVRVEDGAPILLDRHLARLARHARELGIDHPGDEALARDLAALADAGGRLLIRLEVGFGNRLARARPLTPPDPSAYEEGVDVLVTGRRVHPDLAALKTGNQLPCLLAARDAAAVGAFEGLLIDAAGHVVDGSRTSPILVSGGGLVILEGGLEGITRDEVADVARSFGFMVRRSRLRPPEVAGQLLLAGTGVGLVPVGRPQDERIRGLIEHFRLDRPV